MDILGDWGVRASGFVFIANLVEPIIHCAMLYILVEVALPKQGKGSVRGLGRLILLSTGLPGLNKISSDKETRRIEKLNSKIKINKVHTKKTENGIGRVRLEVVATFIFILGLFTSQLSSLALYKPDHAREPVRPLITNVYRMYEYRSSSLGGDSEPREATVDRFVSDHSGTMNDDKLGQVSLRTMCRQIAPVENIYLDGEDVMCKLIVKLGREVTNNGNTETYKMNGIRDVPMDRGISETKYLLEKEASRVIEKALEDGGQNSCYLEQNNDRYLYYEYVVIGGVIKGSYSSNFIDTISIRNRIHCASINGNFYFLLSDYQNKGVQLTAGRIEDYVNLPILWTAVTMVGVSMVIIIVQMARMHFSTMEERAIPNIAWLLQVATGGKCGMKYEDVPLVKRHYTFHDGIIHAGISPENVKVEELDLELAKREVMLAGQMMQQDTSEILENLEGKELGDETDNSNRDKGLNK